MAQSLNLRTEKPQFHGNHQPSHNKRYIYQHTSTYTLLRTCAYVYISGVAVKLTFTQCQSILSTNVIVALYSYVFFRFLLLFIIIWHILHLSCSPLLLSHAAFVRKQLSLPWLESVTCPKFLVNNETIEQITTFRHKSWV